MSERESLLKRIGEPLGYLSSLLAIIQVATSDSAKSIGSKVLTFFPYFGLFVITAIVVGAIVGALLERPDRPWATPVAVAAGALAAVSTVVFLPERYEELDTGSRIFLSIGAVVMIYWFVIEPVIKYARRRANQGPPEDAAGQPGGPEA